MHVSQQNKILQCYYFCSTQDELVYKTNLNFVYTLHHTVVSKTILACTAVYNAHIHSECFILANLDQSVTKHDIAIQIQAITSKLFSTQDAVSLLVKKMKRQNLNFVYTHHHIVVSKTTLLPIVLKHILTGKFRPASNKTSNCNINVDKCNKMSKFVSTQDAVSLLGEKSKKDKI